MPKSTGDSGLSSIPAASVRKVLLLAALTLREARPPGACPAVPGSLPGASSAGLPAVLVAPALTPRGSLHALAVHGSLSPRIHHPGAPSPPPLELICHGGAAGTAARLRAGKEQGAPRANPATPPGAGAPPRCSARGGAHQVNAARRHWPCFTPPDPGFPTKTVPATPTCLFPRPSREETNQSDQGPHSPPGGGGRAPSRSVPAR